MKKTTGRMKSAPSALPPLEPPAYPPLDEDGE